MSAAIEWTCETCPTQPKMGHEEFIEHAGSVHGIPRGTLGNVSFISHGDGTKFYYDRHRWTWEGLSAVMKQTWQRTGADLAFWGGLE